MEQDDRPVLHTEPAQAASAHHDPARSTQSAPQMYPNATQFGLHAAQLTNVQGVNYNLNVNQMAPTVPVPSLVVPETLQGRQIPQTSVPSTPSPQAAVYSESGNYSCQLLCQWRGFPLYVPKDVTIGDVGRLTSEGQFEVFFNIYDANLPADLVSLSRYHPMDVVSHDFDPGNYVSSASVLEINGGFPEFPGGQFVFNCVGPNGAVLALPHGAHQEKLENRKSMQQFAEKHAESWYKYVNGTRGRELVNGSLYLVTGWERAKSWGMAAFRDVSHYNDFQLSFTPTTDADHGHRYRWRAPYCHHKYRDSSLADGIPPNHTTFIHAFAISVCEGIRGKLFGVATCQPVDSTTFPDTSGRSFVPYGSQGPSFIGSLLFGRGGSSGGKQYNGSAPVLGSGMVSEAFPVPKIFHPSQIIHERILREVPKAKVVITHDDDWRDVFRDDGIGQNLSALQQAIFDRFEIVEEDGAAFLMPKSHTTVAGNAATLAVGEQRQTYGPIAEDGLLDNARLPSEGAVHDISAMGHYDGDYRVEANFQTNSTDSFSIELFNLASPRTPSYHGSCHNSPYSTHSELSFTGEPESFSLSDDEPAGSTAVPDYDPFTYHPPQSPPSMSNNNEGMLDPYVRSRTSWVPAGRRPHRRGASDDYSPSGNSGRDSGKEGKRHNRASSFQIESSPPMNVAQVFENMNLGFPNWGPESLSPSSPHLQPRSPPRLLMSDNTEGNPLPMINAPEGDGLAFHVYIEPPPLMGVASTALPSQTTLADLNFTGEHVPDYDSSDLDLPQSSPLILDGNNAGQTSSIGLALEDTVLMMNEDSLSHPQLRLDSTNTSPRRSSFGSHTTEGQLKKFSFGPPPGSAELDMGFLSPDTDLQRSQPDVEGDVTDSIPNSRFLSPVKQREHQHSRSLSSGVTFLSVPGLVGGSQTTAASSTRLSPYPSPNTSPSLHYAGLNRRRRAATFASPVPGHNECKWSGCGKKFSRQYDAKRHEQLHTNYRPFTCDGCDDRFVRMDDLNRHRGAECQLRLETSMQMPDFTGVGGLIPGDTAGAGGRARSYSMGSYPRSPDPPPPAALRLPITKTQDPSANFHGVVL